jgi:hypothetical protein
MQHNVRVIKVCCGDSLVPTDEFIDNLRNAWADQERAEAAVLGIDLAMIQDTYRKLRDLEELRFDRKEASHMSTVRRVLVRCERGLERRSVDLEDISSVECEVALGESDVFIIGNGESIESWLTSDVLKFMLEDRTHRSVIVAPTDVREALRQLERARIVIAVLMRGTLEDGYFATLLSAAKGKKGVQLVPVVADPMFHFPGFRKSQDCVEKEVPSMEVEIRSAQEVRLYDAYRWMFNIVSLRFSPHGTRVIQEEEAEYVATRLRQALEPTYGARLYL